MPTQGVENRHLEVLLVEDNADDALLLERHLLRNGVTPKVVRVETSAELTEALASGRSFDVVLADYNLPAFSGPAALQMLKASGHDIPFIMMSGAVSEETAVSSMRAGAHDYVTKQNLTRLVPAIERELKEAAARSQRRAAERALTASEARFHRLVETMPLGLVISNAAGNITYANAAIERLLGHSVGDLCTGTIPLDSLLPDLHAPARPTTQALSPSEHICLTVDGQSIDVLVLTAVLNPEAESRDRQTAAFIADLTLQKKSEEVLRRTEKLAVAGRLAASIAHEINNPLEAITNCLYLLGQTSLEQDGRAYLELAQKELDRVAQITVQTLKFYRGSTKPVRTDVNDLISSVLIVFDSRMRQHQVQVVRQQRPIPLIDAHEGEIRQVVVNLIGNAIDALPGGGCIHIRTAPGCDWTTHRPGVSITIADTGIGMDPAIRARIFEPFYSTKGITGTGLGLWVSHEIVDRHQGLLRVRSRRAKPGHPGGTVFRLFIPAEMHSPIAS